MKHVYLQCSIKIHPEGGGRGGEIKVLRLKVQDSKVENQMHWTRL